MLLYYSCIQFNWSNTSRNVSFNWEISCFIFTHFIHNNNNLLLTCYHHHYNNYYYHWSTFKHMPQRKTVISANNNTLKKKNTKCKATISTCKAKEKVLRHLSTKYLCTASDTSSTWMYILLKIKTKYSYCNSRSIKKQHHKLYWEKDLYSSIYDK